MRLNRLRFGSVILVTLVFSAFSGVLVPPTQAQSPLLTVYLCAAGGNPARVAWTGVIAQAFRSVGIDARIDLSDWNIWLPRVLYPNASMLGATYQEGGWDIFFLGWTWGNSWIDPTSLYDNDSIPLFNFCLINDPQIEALLDKIRHVLDPSTRIQYQKNLQVLTHNLSALQVLLYPNTTYAINPSLTGFANQTYNFPQFGDPMFRNPSSSSIKIGTNGQPHIFNPHLTTSWYAKIAIAVCYDTLFYYPTNEAMFTFNLVPSLAAGPWLIENDGLNWTLELRSDVFWPDGYQFNASDVIMTFQAILQPAVGASLYDTFVAAGLTNDSFHILDSHTIRVTFNKTLGCYAWTPQLLGTLPIMSFAQMGKLTWADWATHGTSTGTMWTGTDVNGDPFVVYGPYGLGPYVCRTSTSGWSDVSSSFIADRRGGLNDIGLVNGTVMAYHDGILGHYNTPLNDQWVVKVPLSGANAILALQNRDIDLIDKNCYIQPLLHQIDPAWGSIINLVELSFQFFGVNMMHPVFGTGINTPNGQTDPANATLYAKYVRQAFNYLIPRQTIIDTILDGFGVAGNEYLPPGLPAFNLDFESYQYNPTRAKELLRKAGFNIPEEPTLPFDFPWELIFLITGTAVIIVEVMLLVYLLIQRKPSK